MNCNRIFQLFTDCFHLTGEGVHCLLTGLKNLGSMNLEYLQIKYLLGENANNCNLRYLKLRECRQLPVDELEMAIGKMPFLRALERDGNVRYF